MKPCPCLPGRQRGIAVITAILIAAMVASLAFALSARERQWLNQAENRRDLYAAQSLALSAIDLARLTLRDDIRNNAVDHLLETWTIPVPPINVDDAKVGGRLVELQGRFNLFNLQRGGKVNPEGVKALQRLLSLRNLPTHWATPMAQAMAAQTALQENYARSSGSDVAALLTVSNLAQLASLADLPVEKLGPLENWVALLPETTPVNVNFASPEVLMAVTPDLSLKEAESLVTRRASAYFKTAQEFISALPESARISAKSASYTVESQYFLSEIEATSGRAHVRLSALINRSRSRFPSLLWIRTSP